jgi:hypothetical protein
MLPENSLRLPNVATCDTVASSPDPSQCAPVQTCGRAAGMLMDAPQAASAAGSRWRHSRWSPSPSPELRPPLRSPWPPLAPSAVSSHPAATPPPPAWSMQVSALYLFPLPSLSIVSSDCSIRCYGTATDCFSLPRPPVCRCFPGSSAGGGREHHPPRRRRPPWCHHRSGETSGARVQL